MAYCSRCGYQIDDRMEYCPYCGNQVRIESFTAKPVNTQSNSNRSTLYLIALIFMIITLSFVGLYALCLLPLAFMSIEYTPIAGPFFIIVLIPLAWLIPMTVHLYKCYKENKEATIAFKICTLIFCNMISGILLLCSTDNN